MSSFLFLPGGQVDPSSPSGQSPGWFHGRRGFPRVGAETLGRTASPRSPRQLGGFASLVDHMLTMANPKSYKLLFLEVNHSFNNLTHILNMLSLFLVDFKNSDVAGT